MDTNLVNTFIVSTIVLVAIPLLVRPLTEKIGLLLEARANEFWASVSATNKHILETLVTDARLAFTTLNSSGQITDAVNKERDYVIHQVQVWFTSHNFVIDVTSIVNEFAKQVQLGLQDLNNVKSK